MSKRKLKPIERQPVHMERRDILVTYGLTIAEARRLAVQEGMRVERWKRTPGGDFMLGMAYHTGEYARV